MSKQFEMTKKSGEVSVWAYDDDKLDFDSWVKSELTIAERWHATSIAAKDWTATTPGEVSPSGAIFLEWAVYANAAEEK